MMSKPVKGFNILSLLYAIRVPKSSDCTIKTDGDFSTCVQLFSLPLTKGLGKTTAFGNEFRLTKFVTL
jgi:hypothetical protein